MSLRRICYCAHGLSGFTWQLTAGDKAKDSESDVRALVSKLGSYNISSSRGITLGRGDEFYSDG